MSTKSDEELFEDAFDTPQPKFSTLIAANISSPIPPFLISQPSIPPPTGPPPPLPEHLVSPESEQLPSLPISPVSSIPPPLPPRKVIAAPKNPDHSAAASSSTTTTQAAVMPPNEMPNNNKRFLQNSLILSKIIKL